MSMRRRESDRQKPLWVPTGQIAEALEAESLTPVARVDARGHRLTSRRHLLTFAERMDCFAVVGGGPRSLPDGRQAGVVAATPRRTECGRDRARPSIPISPLKKSPAFTPALRQGPFVWHRRPRLWWVSQPRAAGPHFQRAASVHSSCKHQ